MYTPSGLSHEIQSTVFVLITWRPPCMYSCSTAGKGTGLGLWHADHTWSDEWPVWSRHSNMRRTAQSDSHRARMTAMAYASNDSRSALAGLDGFGQHLREQGSGWASAEGRKFTTFYLTFDTVRHLIRHDMKQVLGVFCCPAKSRTDTHMSTVARYEAADSRITR